VAQAHACSEFSHKPNYILNLASIWTRPAYLPSVQPPLTDEMVTEAEAKLGHKLPAELIEVLKIQNGGYLRKEPKSCPSRMILGIGPHRPSITTLIWDKAGLIPFDEDGHWYLCLDYRLDENAPCVTYIRQGGKEKKIASSFNEFLSQLKLKTFGHYVLEDDEVIPVVKGKIEKALDIKFNPPNSWADGIPTAKTKDNDSWITFNTNMIPSGFVRKDDDRYEELKPSETEWVKRYDELEENAYLLKVFKKDAEKEVFEKLSAVGLNFVKIAPLIRKRSRK